MALMITAIGCVCNRRGPEYSALQLVNTNISNIFSL